MTELQAGLKHRSSVRQCVSTGQGRALYGPVGHNIIFSLVCSKISPRNVNVIYLVCIFYYLTGGGMEGKWAGQLHNCAKDCDPAQDRTGDLLRVKQM